MSQIIKEVVAEDLIANNSDIFLALHIEHNRASKIINKINNYYEI